MAAQPENIQKELPIRHRREDSLFSTRNTTSGAENRPSGSHITSSDAVYLREHIDKLLQANPIGLSPEGHYVPDRELDKLLRDDTIKGALGQDINNALVEYVLQKARKTFAVLQLVFSKQKHRREAMLALKAKGFTDDMLESESLVVCGSQRCENFECLHHFPYPKPWDSIHLNHFKSLRWQFLVPDFQHKTFRYEFDPRRLLPFKARVDSKGLSSGNFSDVICVEMLADKQDLLQAPSGETILVAHKTLRPLNVPNFNIYAEWFREAEAHKQLNTRSPHLVRGIAAYHRKATSKENDTYHIVLEWADGDNLHGFWNKDSAPQLDVNVARSRKRILALLEQLVGLSQAVECIHAEAAPVEAATTPKRDLSVLTETGRRSLIRASTMSAEYPAGVAVNLEQAVDDGDVPGLRENQPGTGSVESSGQGVGLAPPAPPRHHARRTSDAKNWRHGDIKPENILRFTKGEENVWIGTLKLADLGRAQQHDQKTEFRNTIERERWRTRWYEPPDLSEDLHKQAHGKISRLFDIWSMGCVIFESVLWLLYGSRAIERFQKIETLTAATPYWRKVGDAQYRVTDRVSLWMGHILKHDAEQSSALGDMVKLVRDRLLIVDLPPNSDVYTPGKRTNAKDMKEQLTQILEKARQDRTYLFDGIDKFEPEPQFEEKPTTDQPTADPPASRRYPGFLSPETAAHPNHKAPVGQATRIAQESVYTDSMTDIWQYPDDHHFAERMIAGDQIPNDDILCDYCKSIDIVSSKLVFDRLSLENNSEECVLCELISKAIDRVELPVEDKVRLVRNLDCLVAHGSNGTELKILRLCCPDYESSKGLTDVPIGAPSLYDPPPIPKAADAFMRLPRAWLEDCNRNHGATCATTHDGSQLPARLLDLRSKKPKIVDSADIKSDLECVRYIAFSHKWGNMPDAALTEKNNLQSRRTAIAPRDIPSSFADAIAVTKALGCEYLWIDSLCINQGKDGDFAEQADSMQTIFSNAYCVIAAASAEGATDGFLKRNIEHNPLDAVKVGNVYVSAVTNDFSRDVLQSPLNSRGWVLQERALARRTIFFTANQMYWECGDGVRCETLRKLKHDEIAFLGDARFPSRTIGPSSTRGEQIHLWTALFMQYTQLGFSQKEDRPVAIQGLMDRLTFAFKTQSHAGLFERFWGRCLLWQRAQDGKPLKWIPPGEHTKKLPPSWSWMAVDGPIDFLRPEGGQVVWNTDVVLPFQEATQASHLQPNPQPRIIANGNVAGDAIHAKAFNFKASPQNLTYDDGRQHVNGKVQCVVIATTKDDNHYVLLVSSALHAADATHERVGVGYLPEASIDRMSGVKATIG